MFGGFVMHIIVKNILLLLSVIIVAPIIGGLLSGIDRKITARMQNRIGPPIFQPFYDFFKLMGKDIIIVNQGQMLYVFGHLMFMVASLGMLVFQQDVLMLIFVLTFSNILLIMGAMSAKSPYSKIGAQREIMQMMAYEPVLLLMVIGIYIVDRSFMIKDIFKFDNGKPLVFSLPLIFIAFLFILTIKLRKSPFDFSTSHHGHQELQS